jgi:hypothetical protein
MPIRITDEDDDGFFAEEDDQERDLGPDERDLDLLDGSWEEQYYSGRMKTRDWNGILVGVALLVLLALVLPMFLVFVN